MEQLTIDRSKWLCGRNNMVTGKTSVLRDDAGNKCCLGFYLESRGYDPKELLNVGEPADLDIAIDESYEVSDCSEFLEGLCYKNAGGYFCSAPANSLMIYNDTKDPEELKEVEKNIALVMREQLDTEVTFVGDYLAPQQEGE